MPAWNQPRTAHGRGLPAAGNGAPAFGVSNLAAFLGDSLTEHEFGSTPFYILNGLLGAPLQVIANSGFSGVSAFGLIGQIEGSYRLATGPGWDGLPAMGWGFLRCLTNTLRGAADSTGVVFDSSHQTDLVTLITRCLDFVEHLVIFAVPPIGDGVTVTQNTTIPAANAWLEAYCEGNPRLHWIDDCADLRDAGGAAIPEFFDADVLHMNGAGAYQMALTAEPFLAALLANQAYGSAVVTDAADVYPAQPQWVNNPTNAGTDGSKGAGWTGTCPTGCTVSTYGSGAAGAVSIVAADGGDPNATPWLRITPSACSSTSNIQIAFASSGRSITSIDPDTLEQIAEVRFNAFTKFKRLDYWCQAGGRRFTKKAYLRWSGSTGANRTVTLRQKMYRIDADASSTPTSYIELSGSPDYSGDMGSIDVRGISLRG